MRSTSSPRAVNIKTGIRERALIRRSTSNPFVPGNITSSTTRSCSFGKSAIDAALAVVNRFNRITFGLKILSYQLAKADIVVNYEDAFHWLLLSKIERHMDDLRQVAKILHNRPFSCVKKCQSQTPELTKLYNPLTDSLRHFDTIRTFKLGRIALYPRQSM
jgi:hypothetical protein